MESKLMDYLILGLIFVIVINLLTHMFNGNQKGKEEMSQFLGQNLSVQPQIMNQAQQIQQIQQKIDIANSNDMCPIVTEQVNNALDKMIMKQTVEMEQSVPISQQINNKKFTRDEILEYQNDMFKFNEQINNSSSTIDVVDKLNELYTSGNSEMAGPEFKGKTISEVYDGLTQGILDRKKKCVNVNCLIPPLTDKLTGADSYLMVSDKGKYFRHGLMYEDDNVQNGSIFYNNVVASDSQFEEHMVY